MNNMYLSCIEKVFFRIYTYYQKKIINIQNANFTSISSDPVQVTIDAVTPTLVGQKQNPQANVALSWQVRIILCMFVSIFGIAIN